MPVANVGYQTATVPSLVTTPYSRRIGDFFLALQSFWSFFSLCFIVGGKKLENTSKRLFGLLHYSTIFSAHFQQSNGPQPFWTPLHVCLPVLQHADDGRSSFVS